MADLPRISGYELLEELGRGGMGIVYKARQPGLNRILALKMILAGQQASQEMLTRLRIEAESLARLHHPGIVGIYEIGDHEGLPFLAFEYCDGGSLKSRLDGSPLPPQQAAELLDQLARAVQHAHERGIIHRDLKPANVMLANRGPGPTQINADQDTQTHICVDLRSSVAKIADFGLAKRLDDSTGPTHTNDILGTPSYMAPEQAAGRTKEIGPATDIYALGAILYELLTGRPPFKGTTPMETLDLVFDQDPVPPRRLRHRVPRDLDTICMKCLQKEPRRRYASSQMLADDLARFNRGEPIHARPISSVARLWRWCRRQPVMAGLSAASLLLLIGSLGFISYFWRNAVASNRAEAGEKQALDALSYLTDVTATKLAGKPGVEAVRRELLEKSLAFYQNFVTQRGNDATAKPELPLALFRIGNISREIGSKEDALKAYQHAVDLQEALVHEHPKDSQQLETLARIATNLADLQRELGLIQEAVRTQAKVGELWQQLGQKQGQNPAAATPAASYYLNRGVLLSSMGQTDEALRSYQAAQRLLEKQFADRPDDAELQEALTGTYHNLGNLHDDDGRPDEARTYHIKASTLLRQILQAQPANAERWSDLGMSLNSLACLERKANHLDEARKLHQEAIRIQTKLATEHPDQTAFQNDLATSYNNHGVLDDLQDDPQAALGHYQQAIAIREHLVQQGKADTLIESKLANNYINIVDLQVNANQNDEALRTCQKAITILQMLVQASPEIAEFRSLLGRAQRRLGWVQQHRGQFEDARSSYQTAVQLLEDLRRAEPQNPQHRFELAACFGSLGHFYLDRQQTEDALSNLLKAQELYAALLKMNPSMPRYTHGMSITYKILGQLYRQMGKTAEAEFAEQEAQELRKGLEK